MLHAADRSGVSKGVKNAFGKTFFILCCAASKHISMCRRKTKNVLRCLLSTVGKSSDSTQFKSHSIESPQCVQISCALWRHRVSFFSEFCSPFRSLPPLRSLAAAVVRSHVCARCDCENFSLLLLDEKLLTVSLDTTEKYWDGCTSPSNYTIGLNCLALACEQSELLFIESHVNFDVVSRGERAYTRGDASPYAILRFFSFTNIRSRENIRSFHRGDTKTLENN